ncbi:hypothetical protein JW905_12405 [bacterium]|nr:hypothetical protein [candidate division CSSED10-310 bacterium]
MNRLNSITVLLLAIVLMVGCADERHFSKAQKYYQAKMYQEAMREFEFVKNNYPESEYVKKAAELYKQCQHHLRAQRFIEEAHLLDQQGSYDAAREKYEQALNLMIMHNLGDAEQVRQRIEELLENRMAEFVQKGDRYYTDRMFIEALDEYDKAWEFSNQDPNSDLSRKRKSARRQLLVMALEAKIREAEEYSGTEVAQVESGKTASKPSEKSHTIDIIRGPGTRKQAKKGQGSEEVNLTRMRDLWDKMMSDSLSADEEKEVEQMAEKWDLSLIK